MTGSCNSGRAALRGASRSVTSRPNTRSARRLMPGAPLIMYSAFGDRYVEQQASLLGVSSVISKSEPVTTVVGTARSLLTQTAA